MNSTAIDENVIKLTLETLGKVIKQVPLTTKLFSRPPFKFIHDIIKEIIRNNGFLTGLYTDDELSSENIKDKEAKIQFLQKSIDALGFITNKPLNQIKASKIVAGLEPEHTNEFLQILGKCVISRKESSLAVRKVLKGEKLDANNTNLSVDDDLMINEKPLSQKKRNSIQLSRTDSRKTAAKQSTNSTDLNKKSSKIQSQSINTNKVPIKTKLNVANITAPKNSIKSTAETKLSSAKKPAISSKTNSATKASSRRTKLVANEPIASKQHDAKQAQERIAKPVTKYVATASSPNKTAVAKKTNLVNQTNEHSNKNRTLTKKELTTLQTTASKQIDRAEEQTETNEEPNLKSQNEDEQTNERIDVETEAVSEAKNAVSLEEVNQAIVKKSMENHGSNKASNEEIEKNETNTDQLEHRQHTKSNDYNSISSKNQRQSALTKQKSAKQIEKEPIKSAINRTHNNNEMNRSSARRPIVDRQNDEIVKPSEQQPIQRPTTASRPLTARAAPPRAVSRRALREETSNVLEMASLTRPQTASKQALVTNLIRESNDSQDEEEENNSEDEKLIKRALTASRGHTALKEVISKLDEQNDFMSTAQNKSQTLSGDEREDPEKGSLVKKLMKSKQELEGDIEGQLSKVSSASLTRSNRDIERLKDHIQTLTKLVNPLSKLLDNLQEDIDLMLLEERNWLEEQQRNEQQLLVLRIQMDNELKSLFLEIANLDDQIQQERDAITVTNVNLLINQAKLQDIVRKMIEN